MSIFEEFTRPWRVVQTEVGYDVISNNGATVLQSSYFSSESYSDFIGLKQDQAQTLCDLANGTIVGNQDFVDRVLAMSSEERVGYLVSAGINHPDGKLTEPYK